MSQVSIPLSMPGGFKSLEAAKAHREIIAKAQSLRSQAKDTADVMKKADRDVIDTTPSDQGVDLAAGKGHVIMVEDTEDGSTVGVELKYNESNGNVNLLVADVPDGKLTQGPEFGDDAFSPTYKWEEKNEAGGTHTTFFKFDFRRNVLAVLDPKSDNPKMIANGNPKVINELASGTLQGGIPIIQF